MHLHDCRAPKCRFAFGASPGEKKNVAIHTLHDDERAQKPPEKNKQASSQKVGMIAIEHTRVMPPCLPFNMDECAL
jgi:hypothetical protein